MNQFHFLTRAFLLVSTALVSISASAYDFPLRADDLNLNHRYSTGAHWSGGTQEKGFDIGAVRHIGSGQWSGLKTDGADNKVNSNYIIYGAKIRAMAAGKVVGCWRNSPQNVAGSKLQKVLDGYIGLAGNHVWVLQDDGVYALYAHAQPGTVPAAICPHNATYLPSPETSSPWTQAGKVAGGVRVQKGQVLGVVGNSGNSTGPHLHVHMEKDGLPVAIKFDHGQTTPFTNNNASVNGPWTLLNGKVLPAGKVLVWAPHSVAYWTVNNIPDERFQAWFNHFADSGVMLDTVPCTDGGQIYNTTWVPSSGSWYAHAGLSLSGFNQKSDYYANLGYTRTGWWYCGSVYTGIWRK
ncbi:MAG: family metallopeptidase [Cellvibrio sp.]|nr:family metallopeptidase [Cellvibrio sp.]